MRSCEGARSEQLAMARGTVHDAESRAQCLNWGIEAPISEQQLVGDRLVSIVLIGVYQSLLPLLFSLNYFIY